MSGIDKHRSNDSILGVTEITQVRDTVRDNEGVDQGGSHRGREKCLNSGCTLKIKQNKTRANDLDRNYGKSQI